MSVSATQRSSQIEVNLHILISSGYAPRLIIEAFARNIKKDTKSTTADPVQISCHFIASLHIKTLKSGRSYTNLCAEFFQNVGIQPLFRKHERTNIKGTKFPVS